MFTAALFTRANTWRQPKGPLTDERVKKMRAQICNGILFSQEWNGMMPHQPQQHKCNLVAAP